MAQNVTLKDIAKIAGISVNSVSKALRDSSEIASKTKERVKEIALDLGYFPNVHAQSLRNGRFNVIAIVYDNLTNPYYQMMLGFIQSELLKKEYESMIFVDYHLRSHLSSTLTRNILSYGVKGILTFINPTENAKKLLEKNNVPIVLLGRKGDDVAIDSVYSNDRQGGAIAANELLKCGGKEFAYITESSELQINDERFNGFKETLINNKINNENIHLINEQSDLSIEEQLSNILKEKIVDSIYCFNDIIALKIARHVQGLGYKIPSDIRIVGVDNIQEFLPSVLRISSIDTPKTNVVKKSLEFLFSEDNGTIRSYCEDVCFIKGDTTN